jgi:TPR repeat protein
MQLTARGIKTEVQKQISKARQLCNYEKCNKAFKIVYPLAQKGYSSAQNMVANLYQFGRGVKKDLDKAIYWYKKSAEKNNVQAYVQLGFIYADIKKHGKSIEFMTFAAILGHENSIRYLCDVPLYKTKEIETKKAHIELEISKVKNEKINIFFETGMIPDGKKIKKLKNQLEKLEKELKDRKKQNLIYNLKWQYVMEYIYKDLEPSYPPAKHMLDYIQPEIEQAIRQLSPKDVKQTRKKANVIIHTIVRNSKNKKYDRTPPQDFWP